MRDLRWSHLSLSLLRLCEPRANKRNLRWSQLAFISGKVLAMRDLRWSHLSLNLSRLCEPRANKRNLRCSQLAFISLRLFEPLAQKFLTVVTTRRLACCVFDTVIDAFVSWPARIRTMQCGLSYLNTALPNLLWQNCQYPHRNSQIFAKVCVGDVLRDMPFGLLRIQWLRPCCLRRWR